MGQVRRSYINFHAVIGTVFLVVLLLAADGAVARNSYVVYPEGDPAHQRENLAGRVFASIQAAVDKAGPGDLVHIMPGVYQDERSARYTEDVTLAKAGLELGADPGVVVEGTIRVAAPRIRLGGGNCWGFVITDADACIVFERSARDCVVTSMRLVISGEKGVALNVVGPDAGNLRVWDSLIYTPGGKNPTIEHRGFPYNWKRFERAGVGVRICDAAGNDGATLHHNRIAGYQTGVWIGGADEHSAPALKTRLWKNQITANTTGIRLLASDCLLEYNEIARSTDVGIVAAGRNNTLLANRVLDSAAWGMQVGGAKLVNNLVAGNRGGGLRLTGGAEVIHNTFVSNGGTLLRIEAGTAHLVNNLVDHAGPLFEGDGAVDRHHNVYANHDSPRKLGEGSRAGLVPYRDKARRDFRPGVRSVAVDAATDVEGVGRDAAFGGRVVGDAADAGAFEVGPAIQSGRAWWVDTGDSNESGDGTRGSPFKSITQAVRDAGPDDRVYLMPGTYEENVVIRCAGAAGHPVTIRPAPGVGYAADRVTKFVPEQEIEIAPAPGGAVTVVNSSWKLDHASHVVIEGIEFRDSENGVIVLKTRSRHVAVRRCTFFNCPRSDPAARSAAAGIVSGGLEASDILIEDNVFDRRPNADYHHRETDVINPGDRNRCQRWIFRRNRIAGYEKLQLGAGHFTPGYHRIEDNEFFECNRAVHIKSSDNIIRGNHVHHLVAGYTRQTVGLMNRGGHRNVYEGNRVEGCNYAGVLLLARDNIVRNNVFDRCDTAVLVATREFGAAPAIHSHVLHNTIVNCHRAVHVDPKCSAMVYNNIIYRSSGAFKQPAIVPAIVGDGMGIYPREQTSWTLFGRRRYTTPGHVRGDHNLYWNAEPAYLHDMEGGHHDRYADPRFVDAAAGNYRLKPDSPARGAGRSVGVGQDFDDRSRPLDLPDCGAFQHAAP